LAWWGIFLYLLQLRSRRQLDFRLDAQGTCVLANLNRLAQTQQQTRPVHGTLDHFVGHVVPEGFATVRTYLVRQLIRSKVLEPARLCGQLVVPLDGTGLFAFRQRHCDHCLVGHRRRFPSSKSSVQRSRSAVSLSGSSVRLSNRGAMLAALL